jgi:DeoR/GlpR family transcriptional regulator of sugar metabolism
LQKKVKRNRIESKSEDCRGDCDLVGLSGREERIVKLLQNKGELSVSTLSKNLGVSAVTIRSDLKALEAKGVIIRSHGSAMSSYHPQFIEKQTSSVDLKEAIAKRAAALIEDGDKMMVCVGTTTGLIGKYLLGKRNIQIVTNSTLLIPYARFNPNFYLTIVGGEFKPSAEALVGPATAKQLAEYHVAYTFTGTDGFSVEGGLSTQLMETAEIVRQMLGQGSKRILLADSTKFGKQGFVKICPLTDIDMIITDKGLPQRGVDEITELGIELVIV